MALLALAFALLWAVLCVSWAWSYPRSVASAAGARFRAALERELEGTTSDPDRVATVNVLLDDVEHGFESRARLPVVSAWLTALGAMLAVVGGFVLAPSLSLLGCLPIALVGIAACLWAQRRGRLEIERTRASLDEVVREVVGTLYDAEVELPARSPVRQRRRRRTSRRLARR